MTATKTTDLASLTSVDAAADFLFIVDTSDTSMAASGTTKKLLPSNLPVSTAQQTALDLKANLVSPALTGTPTAPTATGGTNTTQIASTAFVTSAVAAAVTGLLEFYGNIDCSVNPNYPSASKGDTYYVSVAGKIGGASGVTVAVGDAIVCKADNDGGTEASVGTSWFVLEKNLAGALLSANNLSDVADAATARTNLGLTIGTNVQAYDAGLSVIAGLADPNADRILFWDDSAGAYAYLTAGSGLTITGTTITSSGTAPTECIIIAVGDESTAITTGTAKVVFRMPYAFTLTAVRASLSVASSGGIPTIDINEGDSATTILSTKLTIDANEKTSTTAATAAVISDTSLADDAQISIDIDVAGTGAAGLKVYLIGVKT